MNFLKKIISSIEGASDKPSQKVETIYLTKEIVSKSLNRKVPTTDEFELKEVYISEGDYFVENQVLFCLGSKIHGSGLIYIRLSFGGRIGKILIDSNKLIAFNSKLLTCEKVEDTDIIEEKVFEQNKSELEKTEVSYLIDDFTDDKTIKVTKVGIENTPYFKLYRENTRLAFDYLGLTFINHNGNVYLSFNSRNEDITLAKGDSLIFLFTDKTRISMTFNSAGKGTKGFRHNHFTIGFEELNTFLTKDLLKMKMISKRKNLYSIYTLNHQIHTATIVSNFQKAQYSSEKEGQYLLRFMTGRFIDINQKFDVK